MTLPSSGALTLADIQTEFGGSNPISLNEYYAGGSYVPSGTSGSAGAVPSSGQIDINVFHGTSRAEAHTLTQGVFADKFSTSYGYQQSSYGALSPSTSALLSGDTINACYWSDLGFLAFSVTGTLAQSAFTTLTVTSTPYATASASFSSSGGITTWSWSEATNRFPTFGATYTVSLA